MAIHLMSQSTPRHRRPHMYVQEVSLLISSNAKPSYDGVNVSVKQHIQLRKSLFQSTAPSALLYVPTGDWIDPGMARLWVQSGPHEELFQH